MAPDVPIVDLTHGIVRHGVRHGALVLANALPYVPVGVHVAVVDPQVGTERRALAVRCGDGRDQAQPETDQAASLPPRSAAIAGSVGHRP